MERELWPQQFLQELLIPLGNRVAVANMVGKLIEFEILLFSVYLEASVVDTSIDYIKTARFLP